MGVLVVVRVARLRQKPLGARVTLRLGPLQIANGGPERRRSLPVHLASSRVCTLFQELRYFFSPYPVSHLARVTSARNARHSDDEARERRTATPVLGEFLA